LDLLNISLLAWLLTPIPKGEAVSFQPMYIGKAEKKGVTHPISENINAIYGFQAYKKPSKKYITWAKALFETNDPPILKEPIFFFIAPWFTSDKGLSGLSCSLPAAEKEMIAIASVQFVNTLLNVDGV
jgi:hypothetical protein